ncbi:MAG TPA: hypothetical protein VFH47_07015 [Candidatus Thermoplasmatota archaeon]|nr:hypothetical protein [Candidatus Thermoplasmatota archaeon]
MTLVVAAGFGYAVTHMMLLGARKIALDRLPHIAAILAASGMLTGSLFVHGGIARPFAAVVAAFAAFRAARS